MFIVYVGGFYDVVGEFVYVKNISLVYGVVGEAIGWCFCMSE